MTIVMFTNIIFSSSVLTILIEKLICHMTPQPIHTFKGLLPTYLTQFFMLINVVGGIFLSGSWGQSYGAILDPMGNPSISKARD